MKRSAPMRRSAWDRRPPPPREPAPTAEPIPRLLMRPDAPVRAVIAGRLENRAPAPVPKPQPFRSEAWLDAVRTIPCVFCGAPVQAAHRNEGKGMGTKADDSLTAALCHVHHSEIDQGRDMTRDERRARMDRAIVLTVAELVRRGIVGIVPR